MSYRIEFTPEAADQLAALYQYIAAAASATIAARYTDAIVSYCESLETFPLRGVARDDVRPGLRITHYKRNTIVAFAVTEQTITVLGIYYGGQDYEAALQPE